MDAGTLIVLGTALNALLGRSGPATGQGQEALKTVAEFVQSATRGEGFTLAGNPSSDLASVIVTATARLLTNPTQLSRKEIGEISLLYQAFDGFTLAERMVLHRYRRRTA